MKEGRNFYMALKNREYLLSVDSYNNPFVIKDNEAIALNLVRLLLLEPGSDPFRPDMGVGLKSYRYALTLDELNDRITEQIQTYLPQYQSAEVNIVRTPERVANIEITLGDVVFIYDSSSMPIPIDLDYVRTN
jgi:hypothetical protein